MVLLAGLLAACAEDDPPSRVPAAMHHHEDMSLAAQDPVSGQSLHLLDAVWTDQHGGSVQLGDFAGRVVVLAMAYTHCEHACPRIIADMRLIRQAFPDQAAEMAFVLASIDPERDTVVHLQAFGAKTGLSAQGWRLLRAPANTVRELAAVLGVQYRRVSDTDFAHSNIISVLGPGGEIRHQQKGLGTAPAATIAAIRDIP